MAIELRGLLPLKQAAALLEIHEKTIFRWLKQGIITPVIVAGQRFIPESEIDRAKRLIREGKLKHPGNRLPKKKVSEHDQGK